MIGNDAVIRFSVSSASYLPILYLLPVFSFSLPHICSPLPPSTNLPSSFSFPLPFSSIARDVQAKTVDLFQSNSLEQTAKNTAFNVRTKG